MNASGSDKPFWSLEAGGAMAAFGGSPSGLTAEEAARRLGSIGPNLVEEGRSWSAARLIARQFESPLVLILIFGAVVSLVLAEWIDASIILAIVVGSSLLGFAQELRASKAVEALRHRLALKARVLRDGVEVEVPAGTIVPGDLLMLSAGNLVPADGLVLEANDFLVTEASLTGESFPVEKQPATVPAEAPLAARTNAVFMGSSVRSGSAKVLVATTGPATAFGAIAARLQAREPETDFQRGVRQFGQLLMRVMILIVLFVLTINQLLGRPIADSLLFAVALAVGLSPELLPAIVSVTLSSGARQLARKGVIVRRLEAIESLGGIDVLCTDKTGTLTQGEVVLAAALDATGVPSDEVARLAYLNAALETGIENPLDAAVVVAGERRGLTIEAFRKIDEIPFDFRRRRLTIVVEPADDPTHHLVITKGAFANVLSVSTNLRRAGADTPLDAAGRQALQADFLKQSAEGHRVLGLAVREVPAKGNYGHDDETDLTFLGFLLFSDPPKPDAERTVHDLARLGIAVKVVTGDNRHVSQHLARSVGLDSARMLTGEMLASMKDEALWHAAPRTDLFVEVDPQQKERIVRALQRTGHAVGFLGDGINDAPALHAADVGISVDGAVDVARESADVVLLKTDLDVLRQGVEDGRRTFVNTLKYITITTSANFGNMVSMALLTPLLPFLPLLPKQILLNNFLSDLPSMAISSDNVDADRVATAQRWDVREVRRFMIGFGLVSTSFDILTFAVLLWVFRTGEAAFQTSWFMVSILTELVVVLILRTRGPSWRSRPSALLFWATILVAAVCLVLPYTGRFAALFGFVPLSPALVAAAIVIVLGYAAATEVAKRFVHLRRRG